MTTTVWIDTDTSKQLGDPTRLFVFASRNAAYEWLKKSDPEGVASNITYSERSPSIEAREITATAKTKTLPHRAW